jgi:hypothetical protein
LSVSLSSLMSEGLALACNVQHSLYSYSVYVRYPVDDWLGGDAEAATGVLTARYPMTSKLEIKRRSQQLLQLVW